MVVEKQINLAWNQVFNYVYFLITRAEYIADFGSA